MTYKQISILYVYYIYIYIYIYLHLLHIHSYKAFMDDLHQNIPPLRNANSIHKIIGMGRWKKNSNQF